MSHRNRPWTRQGFVGLRPSGIGLAVVGLVLAVMALARLQVEWLWFQQFSLESVLFRRWLFQLAAGSVAACIALSGGLWRRNWLQLGRSGLTPDRDDPHRLALSGLQYSLTLLLCAGVVVIDLLGLLRLAWLAWWMPFRLGQWWEQPLELNSLVVALVAGLFTLVVFLARRRSMAALFWLGSLCTCFTAARAWGLWALALTIPSTGEIEPLLGADVSFGLGRFSALALVLQLLLMQLLLTLGTALLLRLTRPPALSDWSFDGLLPIERRRL